MIDGIFDKILDYCKTQEFQQKVQKTVLDPILSYLLAKLYPYLLAIGAFFFLVFTLLALILILVVRIVFAS